MSLCAPRDTQLRSVSPVTVSAADAATAVFYSTAWVHLGPIDKAFAPMDVPSSIGVYTAKFVRSGNQWLMQHLGSKPAFKRTGGAKE